MYIKQLVSALGSSALGQEHRTLSNAAPSGASLQFSPNTKVKSTFPLQA